jgi:serine/threonine-protein kinase RsbW
MNEQQSTISLRFPAKAEYLIVCRLALNGLVDAVPVGEEALSDLKLAVTEACANAISHAYGDGGGPVTMRVAVDRDTLRIEIVDDGVGIEETPAARKNGDAGLAEGGMGFNLIRALVDELDIAAGPDGKGTRVTLTKRLAASEPVR